MKLIDQFKTEVEAFHKALSQSPTVLITAPAVADGDSIASQLALKILIQSQFPQCHVRIINEEPLQERYLFLQGINEVESYQQKNDELEKTVFDLAIIVDGGIDRAGLVESVFKKAKTQVFIDHHDVSADYDYTINMVHPESSSTTELIYHLFKEPPFSQKLSQAYCQHIYFGLIFDTGFFRHSNTTPEALELGAQMIRSGFDFTRLGERGMLERSFNSLKLLAYTLARTETLAEGKIIWSSVSSATVETFSATDDDREGIIDHLLLTRGIDVAILFYEMKDEKTRISLRSHGDVDVAVFARELTKSGGGHKKAAGAMLDLPMDKAIPWVLGELEKKVRSSL